MADIKRVGHVVFGTHDLERSIGFYTGILGMEQVCGIEAMGMAFFTFGERDHDIAVMLVPDEVPIASPGLAHVALEIEGGIDDLRRHHQRLKEAGVPVELTADHVVTQSVYFPDPDGNRLELFCQVLTGAEALGYMRSVRTPDQALRPLDLEAAAV